MSTYLDDPDEWISQAEAARLRGVSRQAIAVLVRKRRLSVLNIGGRVFVKRRDVEEFTPEQAGRPPKASKSTDEIVRLIDESDEDEKHIARIYLYRRPPLHPLEREWGTTAEAVLTAIARSTDLTKRGIRGILAEATFEETILPSMRAEGWNSVVVVGDRTYDFALQQGRIEVRIQVKLQRREKEAPKEYASKSRTALKCPSGTMYVVEVQKTRSGERKGVKTRPYRFGDFDILAVNMHPSTGEWKRFMFTVGAWLLPRRSAPDLIETFQPVPARPDDYWTDDLGRCIQWFQSGAQRRLYAPE